MSLTKTIPTDTHFLYLRRFLSEILNLQIWYVLIPLPLHSSNSYTLLILYIESQKKRDLEKTVTQQTLFGTGSLSLSYPKEKVDMRRKEFKPVQTQYSLAQQ